MSWSSPSSNDVAVAVKVAASEVASRLGLFQDETVLAKAIAVELQAQGREVKHNVKRAIKYRDVEVGTVIFDFVIADAAVIVRSQLQPTAGGAVTMLAGPTSVLKQGEQALLVLFGLTGVTVSSVPCKDSVCSLGNILTLRTV